jgi:hypothetical protein
VLGVLILVALPWWRPADSLAGRVGLLTYAPSGLATKLAELAPPGARVVVPQTWGSWFEWAAPDALYFIDSRFELYPADVWTDEAAVRRGGAEAAEVLRRREAHFVVMPPGQLAPGWGWAQVFSDASGSIFVRLR